MKLWAALYGMIWVVFLEFLLGMIPLWQPFLTYGHIGLGFVIVLITYYNFEALRATTVPGRVKRIARTTFQLSVVMVFLGFLVYFNVGSAVQIVFGISVWGVILFLHIANAVAIITQAAATAIAYDMWEEKEFGKETLPGEVPPAPAPVASVAASKP
jgi:hypothetical protein